MAQIIVNPIDPKAKGSFREKQKLLALLVDQSEAREAKETARFIRTQNKINEMAVEHMRTDDGTDIERAIDDIGQDEFDELVEQFIRGKSSVPPVNADNLPKP